MSEKIPVMISVFEESYYSRVYHFSERVCGICIREKESL